MSRKIVPITPLTLLQIELETGLIYMDLVPIGKANVVWLDFAANDFINQPDAPTWERLTEEERRLHLSRLNEYPA